MWFLSGNLPGISDEETAEVVEAEPEPEWELLILENMVLNPAGTQGRRFLIFTAAIEVDGERTLPTLQNADARLRDAILRGLGAWGVEDLADAEQRGRWEELVRQIALEVADDAPVGRVYFSQFLLQ